MSDHMNDDAKPQYTVGQLVNVQPRLWAGINRPGGVGRISQVHCCTQGYIETVDVRYVVHRGLDTKVDLDFVQPHAELGRQSRSRRGREFLTMSPAAKAEASKTEEATTTNNKKAMAGKPPRADRKPTTSSSAQQTKKRRTVSPQTRTPTAAAAPCSASRGVTKASTNHGLTLQTGSELRPAKKAQAKPPVKVIRIPPRGTVIDVSPLPNPPARPSSSSTSSSSSSNAGASYAVKRPLDKTRKKEADKSSALATMTTSPKLLQRKNVNPASASFKRKLARSPRPLPLSASRQRVPLRQVFDTDMNKRKDFVKDVVGEVVVKKPAAKAVAPEPVAAAAVPEITVDQDRQETFNKCLGQLFVKMGDCLSQQALLKHVNKGCDATFTTTEIDQYLKHLADQDRVMISDGEVYQI